MMKDFSSKAYFEKLDAYFCAANYISVGQLYLKDNPLLRRPLVAADIKYKTIGHWGTIPGQNFIYAHLNRVINKYDVNLSYIEGPGHGGQVMVSNAYLDGSYTEIYPHITEDEMGLKKLFKQFSFPGGIASHAAPETPGSMHEGGELGYALSHAVGAALDNPDQIIASVIGDGEAETGPLAASWFSNVFINPITDGAVLPILYLNGFKISNPTILARKTNEELSQFFQGLGWKPIFVEATDRQKAHPIMAKALDEAIEEILSIQKKARQNGITSMPHWPVLILRVPKGWTGPKVWDGKPIEGSFRAHQVPIPVDQNHLEHLNALNEWLKSYKPQELFDENGRLIESIKALTPKNHKRMATNPIMNGGILTKALSLPKLDSFEYLLPKPGSKLAQDMTVLGTYLETIMKNNTDNFRVFGPDETMSNRLSPLFNVTNRVWLEDIKEPFDQFLNPFGRIIDSQLSEHQAEGILEGYVLTGRHGVFTSYEAFLRVVDSMLTQHFKWLRKAKEQTWRHDYPALNIIATSTVFQQDHNGYTHQDPGILTHLSEKKPAFIREYLPADANSLLAVMERCLNERDVINLIVASKQPRPQWFTLQEARTLLDQGAGIVKWASHDVEKPDLVMASSGSEPTLELMAAINILNKAFPKLKIKTINIIDLLRLRVPEKDPRGLSHEDFDALFTKDKPIVFAFHGYEGLIRDIFFDRHNHNIAIHGYRENGDITTPFDIRVLNQMDRFHLAKSAALKVYGKKVSAFIDSMDEIIARHHAYIRQEGRDILEVEMYQWIDLK